MGGSPGPDLLPLVGPETAVFPPEDLRPTGPEPEDFRLTEPETLVVNLEKCVDPPGADGYFRGIDERC